MNRGEGSDAHMAGHGMMRVRRLAWSAAVLGATAAIAGCGGSGEKADVRFCAVAEGSQSTNRADIRTAYLEAFGGDVEWFAQQPGSSPMCLILAVGDPTSNRIAELPIRAENPRSPKAEGIVAENVALAKSQFAQVLATTQDLRGTPLLEALYALADRGDIRTGDTISVYSDMRQDSASLKTFRLARLRNPTRQREVIEAALHELAQNGLLTDGRAGRPSLAGVRIVVAAPSASADVSDPENAEMEAARQVAAKEFWHAWARRVKADLAWGESASGGRGGPQG